MRARYTTKWIEYYRHKLGGKPTDSYWRQFKCQLNRSFFQLCGYCEVFCQTEVEHFRPKSKYPELVYVWSNWVNSCHACNNAKSEKWSSRGLVDPCARTRAARPEEYFVFDITTGRIRPKSDLSVARYLKATNTIEILRLNAYWRTKQRLKWIRFLSHVFGEAQSGTAIHPDAILDISSREAELSSWTRSYLQEQGIDYSGE